MTDKEREWRRILYETKHKPAYDAWIKFYPFTIEDLDGEEWADIVDYEGLYQVSTFGRVKRFYKTVKPRILKPRVTSRGYLQITLCRDSIEKNFLIGRLVAVTFVPNPNNLPQVDHVFGMKFDNSAGNLCWVTGSQNVKNSYCSETRVRLAGEKNPVARLTNEQAKQIRENSKGLTVIALAKEYGIAPTQISDIQRGITYKTAGGNVREAYTSPQNRFSDEIRQQIRAEYQKGVQGHGCRTLAKKFGVDEKTVWNIVNEK